MDIIITFTDPDILQRLQAAYGWQGLTDDEIVTHLKDEVIARFVDKSVQGRRTLDTVVQDANERAKAEAGISVTIKV